MDNNTCALQNREENLVLLSIQRNQYGLAKRWALASFCISVVMVVLLTIIKACLAYHHPNMTPIISKSVLILCLFIGLVDFYIRRIMRGLKKNAALFQELFDHIVIGIQWNELLVGSKPTKCEIGVMTPDNIDKDSLIDWYNIKVSLVEGFKGQLLYQLVNCVYDDELRKKYLLYVNMIMMLLSSLVIVWGLLSGLTFMTLIVLVAQIMPILLWYLRFYDDYKVYFCSMSRTRKYIEKCLTNTDQDMLYSPEYLIRNIQDRIYETRTRTFLIPDFVYKKWRNQCETMITIIVEKYTNDESLKGGSNDTNDFNVQC